MLRNHCVRIEELKYYHILTYFDFIMWTEVEVNPFSFHEEL